MTAPVTMLTDEVIEKAAIRHSDKEHSPFNSDARYHFKAGARFARNRYEAREKLWMELYYSESVPSRLHEKFTRQAELRALLGIDKEGA